MQPRFTLCKLRSLPSPLRNRRWCPQVCAQNWIPLHHLEEHLKTLPADTGSEIPFPSPASLTHISASMMNLAVQNTVLCNRAYTTRLVCYCPQIRFHSSSLRSMEAHLSPPPSFRNFQFVGAGADRFVITLSSSCPFSVTTSQLGVGCSRVSPSLPTTPPSLEY